MDQFYWLTVTLKLRYRLNGPIVRLIFLGISLLRTVGPSTDQPRGGRLLWHWFALAPPLTQRDNWTGHIWSVPAMHTATTNESQMAVRPSRSWPSTIIQVAK